MANPQSQQGKRPTLAEEQDREDFAYELLSRCLLKSQIKGQFRKKYPDISARTIERYLARARVRQMAESGKTRDDMRAESRAFYETIIRDPQAAPRDRIFARERIDRLYGLDAPQKIAPTDPAGENPYAGLDREELVRAIIARAAGTGAATDTDGDGRGGEQETVADQPGEVRGADDEPPPGPMAD